MKRKWNTIVLKKDQASVNDAERNLQNIFTIIANRPSRNDRVFGMNTLFTKTCATATQKPISHGHRLQEN